MSDRYHVTISLDLDVADLAAVQTAAPAVMRRLAEEHGGIESDFVDNPDQAAAYVGMDPQYAMNLVMYDAVLRGLNTPEFAGSNFGELKVNCEPLT